MFPGGIIPEPGPEVAPVFVESRHSPRRPECSCGSPNRAGEVPSVPPPKPLLPPPAARPPPGPPPPPAPQPLRGRGGGGRGEPGRRAVGGVRAPVEAVDQKGRARG